MAHTVTVQSTNILTRYGCDCIYHKTRLEINYHTTNAGGYFIGRNTGCSLTEELRTNGEPAAASNAYTYQLKIISIEKYELKSLLEHIVNIYFHENSFHLAHDQMQVTDAQIR